MHAIVRRGIAAFALLCSLPTVPVASAVCPGDCNGDGTVVVSEIITGVDIALGALDISACRAFDLNNDNMVSVSEIISAVGSVLNGCPIEPIFPANYRDTFSVVRDCRLGLEHGGVTIRVLANSNAVQPYLSLQDPLPVGTVVVKEEYSGTECDLSKLVSWSAMRKERPGFDPVDGDWHWQRLPAPGSTVQTCLRKDDCPHFTCTSSGCHSNPVSPDCLDRDYMCTGDARGKLYPLLQNLSGALLSISGTGPKDVYAVGADAHDGNGPSVLHYDGSTWTRLDSGVASGNLWWISVTPIEGDFYMAGDNGVILQFDPTSGKFARAATPDNTVQLYGIWGTAANDLWAVGADTQTHAVVWHFDGMMWSAQDVSNVVPSDEPTTLYKVWGTSATDVYAVGQTGLIIHFDGGKWSRITGVPTVDLFTVHGAGSQLVAVGGFVASGVILEQSGSSFVDHAPSGTPEMNGVFVTPNGNVVAVGVGLSVATGDSSGWSLVNEGTDRQNRDFHGTWVDSEDGIWAVGGNLSSGNMNNGIVSYGHSQ